MAYNPPYPGTPGDPTDPATLGNRELNADQHAGSGPALTGSGLDLATGAVTADPPTTNMVVGAHVTSADPTNGNIDFGTELIRATFDKIINWRLRYEPMYKQFANVRAIRETAYPGSKVTMFRTGAAGLELAKTPLSEYADPDAVALPGLEDKLDVTVNEYGNSTVVTSRIKRYSWADVDPMQAEYISRNLRDTVDATYMESIYSATGGWLGGGFRQAELAADGVVKLTDKGEMGYDRMFDTSSTTGNPAARYGLVTGDELGGDPATASVALTASHVRRIVAHFRSLGVRPMADGYYVALVTPEIALQLREDSAAEGANGWRYPHLDGSWNGNLLSGTVGVFEGVRFIEGAQFKGLDKGDEVPANTNSIINVQPESGLHNVLFLGSEGICDVIVEDPHTVVTPTTDKFGRLQGYGWLGTWGSQVYDNNAGLLVAVDPTVKP